MQYSGLEHKKLKSKNTIVVIEDEEGIKEILSHSLNKAGFDVRAYGSAEDFICDRDRPIQCVYLIDWKLPGIQGIDIVKLIRQTDKLSPLFMMSANISSELIIIGLQAGADDYILKPFNIEELLLRLKNAQMKYKNMQSNLIHTGLKILPEANCIIVDGKVISFTAREFLILNYLYSRENLEVNRSELIGLFNKDDKIQDRNIDVHVFSLRKKIAKNTNKIDISTVWGKGYKLTTH